MFQMDLPMLIERNYETVGDAHPFRVRSLAQQSGGYCCNLQRALRNGVRVGVIAYVGDGFIRPRHMKDLVIMMLVIISGAAGPEISYGFYDRIAVTAKPRGVAGCLIIPPLCHRNIAGHMDLAAPLRSGFLTRVGRLHGIKRA